MAVGSGGNVGAYSITPWTGEDACANRRRGIRPRHPAPVAVEDTMAVAVHHVDRPRPLVGRPGVDLDGHLAEAGQPLWRVRAAGVYTYIR